MSERFKRFKRSNLVVLFGCAIVFGTMLTITGALIQDHVSQIVLLAIGAACVLMGIGGCTYGYCASNNDPQNLPLRIREDIVLIDP